MHRKQNSTFGKDTFHFGNTAATESFRKKTMSDQQEQQEQQEQHGRAVSKLEDLMTPALVIDKNVAERNAAAMLDKAKKLGVKLRPHVKTHKSLKGVLVCVSCMAFCLLIHAPSPFLHLLSSLHPSVHRCAASNWWGAISDRGFHSPRVDVFLEQRV